MNKKLWKSKTFWVGVITSLLPLVPQVNVWVATNPEAFSALVGVIFTSLRVVTKDKVVIK